MAIPGASVRRALNNLWDKGIIQRERRQVKNRGYFLYWVGALKVSIDPPDLDRVPRSPIAVKDSQLPDLDHRDRQNDENCKNENLKKSRSADRGDQGAFSRKVLPIEVNPDRGLGENSAQPIAVNSEKSVRKLVVYKGNNQSLRKLCGGKRLEILSETPTCAEVRHSGGLITQTIPLIDLQPVK